MADALVSPAVAGAAGVAAAALIVAATRKIKDTRRTDMTPLMGVMGAFVFAAQMINFTIPGTGSSGHVIGGILLASVLGPWAAFLTLCSVLIIQCLVFADGGLMALGCNIVNMAAASCLVAWPLVYRPMARRSLRPGRIMAASVISCVVALEIGAACVTLETSLSGVTALPIKEFLMFMLPIHLAIGAVEGVATGAVLCFLAQHRPDILYRPASPTAAHPAPRSSRVVAAFGIAALVLATAFTWVASEYPDGLEWSIAKVSGIGEMASYSLPTAIMPDYDSTFAGIVGACIVMAVLWAVTTLIFHASRMRRATRSVSSSSTPADHRNRK